MRASIERALSGDREAARALVVELTPVIQARVARVLLRKSAASGRRDAHQEVQDLVQQVFVALFSNGGASLRKWDPERGASLANFVGLVAEREAISILRRRRRSPWGEDPTEEEALTEARGEGAPLERAVLSRDALRRAFERVSASLSERGREMLVWLVVEERTVEEVCAMSGASADAVYAWRSRLGRALREAVQELLSDAPPLASNPSSKGAP